MTYSLVIYLSFINNHNFNINYFFYNQNKFILIISKLDLSFINNLSEVINNIPYKYLITCFRDFNIY